MEPSVSELEEIDALEKLGQLIYRGRLSNCLRLRTVELSKTIFFHMNQVYQYFFFLCLHSEDKIIIYKWEIK